jgi:hypothetical protein
LTRVAVLALGIGANVAIFNVVNSIILPPLPYPNMHDPTGGRIHVTRKNFLEWQRQNTVFVDMAAFREMSLSESGVDRPEDVSTGLTSANLFAMLGVRPRASRLFTSNEIRSRC